MLQGYDTWKLAASPCSSDVECYVCGGEHVTSDCWVYRWGCDNDRMAVKHIERAINQSAVDACVMGMDGSGCDADGYAQAYFEAGDGTTGPLVLVVRLYDTNGRNADCLAWLQVDGASKADCVRRMAELVSDEWEAITDATGADFERYMENENDR